MLRRSHAGLAVVTDLVAALPAGGSAASASSDGPPGDGTIGNVPVPTVTGPVPVTATSHFFDQTPVDIAANGYVEQEFFVRGTANVYDYDPAGQVVIKAKNAPYVNRIVVAALLVRNWRLSIGYPPDPLDGPNDPCNGFT